MLTGWEVSRYHSYSTDSEQQIQYMINDSQTRFLFVGEQEQYDKAHRIFALCPSLERIIIYDDSVRISTHDLMLFILMISSPWAKTPRQSEVEALCEKAPAWMTFVISFTPVVPPVTARA